jgi:hypothetical protein
MSTNIDYMIDYGQFINKPQAAKSNDMNIIIICDLILLPMNINISLLIINLYILFRLKDLQCKFICFNSHRDKPKK